MNTKLTLRHKSHTYCRQRVWLVLAVVFFLLLKFSRSEVKFFLQNLSCEICPRNFFPTIIVLENFSPNSKTTHNKTYGLMSYQRPPATRPKSIGHRTKWTYPIRPFFHYAISHKTIYSPRTWDLDHRPYMYITSITSRAPVHYCQTKSGLDSPWQKWFGPLWVRVWFSLPKMVWSIIGRLK